MSKRFALTGKLFGSLRVKSEVAESRRNKRIWETECERPIHAGQIVTRSVSTGELLRGRAVACLECAAEDRRTSSRAARDAEQVIQLAKVKGCAELLCNPPFHSALCPGVNLSPQTRYTERKDPGTGIYSHA